MTLSYQLYTLSFKKKGHGLLLSGAHSILLSGAVATFYPSTLFGCLSFKLFNSLSLSLASTFQAYNQARETISYFWKVDTTVSHYVSGKPDQVFDL